MLGISVCTGVAQAACHLKPVQTTGQLLDECFNQQWSEDARKWERSWRWIVDGYGKTLGVVSLWLDGGNLIRIHRSYQNEALNKSCEHGCATRNWGFGSHSFKPCKIHILTFSTGIDPAGLCLPPSEFPLYHSISFPSLEQVTFTVALIRCVFSLTIRVRLRLYCSNFFWRTSLVVNWNGRSTSVKALSASKAYYLSEPNTFGGCDEIFVLR